ncbi:MAG TPA: efflux RND transporter periplasmic adaptor subunit [Candidatus Polarisedimenticolia bacterium]|nr:efflux RND transporter periplasmic adaptor subunit [Candidatus Polarisedimenticolia bacterium]
MSHRAGASTDTMAVGSIRLSADRQQFLGVVLTPVTRRPLVREVRTVGRVEYDERRLAFVNLKIGGWIERLDVDFTGVFVRRGQTLLSIYSPELVSAQEEYLVALRGWRSLPAAADSGVTRSARNLLDAARRRLQWWDIRDEHIGQLEESGRPMRTLEVHSPIDGYVIEKMALQGMRIEPGMNLFKIADVTRVWVDASIYEYEVPLVRTGQDATVDLPYTPGKVLHGRISYIYPYLDEATRTVRVRIEFQNSGGALKPGMYAEVAVRTSQGAGLAVPKTAILDTGSRKLVFVSRGDGRFDPREIKTGILAGDYYEVIDGLKEGEQVVTSANFLIDSESQLSTATGTMKH